MDNDNDRSLLNVRYQRFSNDVSNVTPPSIPSETSYFMEQPAKTTFPRLRQLYRYYTHGGSIPMITTHVNNVILALFIIALTFFLFGGVLNYTTLLDTKVTHISQALQWPPQPASSLVWIFLVVFIVIWIWHLVQLPIYASATFKVKRFFSDSFGVSDRTLRHIPWHTLVDECIKNKEPYKWFKLTTLSFAQNIMVEDNCIIAIFDDDVLKLEKLLDQYRWLRHVPLVTQPLISMLHYGVFDFVFDRHRSSFSTRFEKINNDRQLTTLLRRRLYLLAIFGVFFSPFTLCFFLLHFVFKHGQSMHTSPAIIFNRTCSTLAKWKFREWNELPHLFSKRMNKACSASKEYLNQFYPVHSGPWIRSASYMIGALIFVCILATIWQERLLNVILFANCSLLMVMTVMGACYAGLQSMLPSLKQKTSNNPGKAMNALLEYTHYNRRSWRKDYLLGKVQREVKTLFPYRIVHFIQELMGVLTAPLLMFYIASQCTGNLVTFLKSNVEYTNDGVGPVLNMAKFDREPNEMVTSNSVFFSTTSVQMEYHQQKLNQSMMTFKANCPNWTLPGNPKRYNNYKFYNDNDKPRLQVEDTYTDEEGSILLPDPQQNQSELGLSNL